MAETKDWRVKLINRGHRVQWELERLVPSKWEYISIFEDERPAAFDWVWESGGYAKTEKAALQEAEAAKEALMLAEKQLAEAKYIELGD